VARAAALLLLILAAPVFAQRADSITLREYVDVRFAAQEAAVDAALASADRAVAKAEAAAEKRFEGVNEFRAALNDNTRLLMPRSESEQAIKSINEKLETLTARINAREERGRGVGDMVGWIVAGVSTLGAIFAMAALLNRRKPA
jgi:hypothetical protein